MQDYLYTIQADSQKILQSGRIWGMTEGCVYAMDTMEETWRATGGGKGADRAVFKVPVELFKPHPVHGPFSLIKRLLGQYKSVSGDIAFEYYSKDQRKDGMPVYELHNCSLQEHQGQSKMQAKSREYGRIALDVALAAGLIVALTLNLFSSFA